MAKALIGAQLYTVREHLKTPADIAASCKKVKEMGYDGVQLSALGPIEIGELKKILDGEGLICGATHEPLERLRDEPEKVIDEHQQLGCRYTAIGGFFPKEAWTRGLWERFIKDFNAVARLYADAPLSIGYHNHSHEFAPADGAVPMQMLVKHLDPSIWMEIDTYWVTHGGGDPAAWIEKVAGRLPCVHYKDMSITPQRQQLYCEIGAGNLNWARINQACAKAGVEWYLVERDEGEMDPFDSLKISLQSMRAMGL